MIEVEEEPEFVTIPGIDKKVPLLTQGQWMKGCPEGGEQSFLFGLYQQLSDGVCPCPHGCGATIQRKKSDFYALFVSRPSNCTFSTSPNSFQPTFPEYIKHLENIAPRTCAQCSRTFCFACGESSNPPSNKKLPGSLEVDYALFHCSNLQGAILGVGLTMLEKSFLDETQDPSAPKTSDRSSRKRRKVDAPAPPPLMLTDLHNDDDDDDDSYYPIVVQGKKAKLGTGYAGDAREDVRFVLSSLAHLTETPWADVGSFRGDERAKG